MLNKPCQSSLITSHGSSVDNPGTDFFTILVNVVHTKVLSRSAVKLNGYHGIFLTVDILGLNINLGSVESSLIVSLCVSDAVFIHDIS